MIAPIITGATPRTLIWFSTGAASYAAAKIALRSHPDAILVRCETSNEDADNYRFEADAERALSRKVTILQSDRYSSVWNVWQRRRYIAGVAGAPCTGEMKIAPRLAFQLPTDIHVFGYTADAADVVRFERLKETYFEMSLMAPLITAGVTKQGALAMVERDGLSLPRSYALGFQNANCLGTGCGKATSPGYWSLYRKHYPAEFARTAEYSREIGARLARLDGKRVFIDEIPDGYPTTEAIIPACDLLCQITEEDET